jgi:hypothetical protein
MTQALAPFRFHNHEIRVIIREGEPWFVAKDMFAIARSPKGPPRNFRGDSYTSC